MKEQIIEVLTLSPKVFNQVKSLYRVLGNTPEQFTNNLNNKQLEGITKLLKANGNL